MVTRHIIAIHPIGRSMTLSSRLKADQSKCFVVMPFGLKPFNDGSGRHFDFDKIYRVIIKRAVKEAGLTPIRADEQTGSQMIHIDMFKALRDKTIVLVDLSLENPNVFYELGIRHVMSPRGTVLMCREGSRLPFDVSLSRVVFYRFDGADLDWEEAERVIVALKAAIEQARRGQPDSPVHALLEEVYSDSATDGRGHNLALNAEPSKFLEPYQRIVAKYWRQQSDDANALIKSAHGRSIFGCRALGYYSLGNQLSSGQQSLIIKHLYDLEQYDLVNEIFDRLETLRELSSSELRIYGSSKSEVDLTIAGAKQGLKCTEKALELLQVQLSAPNPSPDVLESAFHCHMNISGLNFWMWMLDQFGDCLDIAIKELDQALLDASRAIQHQVKFPIGRCAQGHLKLLFMLRMQAGDRDRPDREGHRDAVFLLTGETARHVRDGSYLRWYQASTWADLGDRRRAQELAIMAISEDARIKDRPDCTDIGRRQYSHLRRFLEQYSSWSPNSDCFGYISQALQVGQSGDPVHGFAVEFAGPAAGDSQGR
jgi:hypothetical protein